MTKLKDKLSASVRQAKAAQEVPAKPQPAPAKPAASAAAPKAPTAKPAPQVSPLYPNRVWPD